jgi:hypothetical protein
MYTCMHVCMDRWESYLLRLALEESNDEDITHTHIHMHIYIHAGQGVFKRIVESVVTVSVHELKVVCKATREYLNMMWVCMCVCIHVCVCVCARARVCIHIHTYMYVNMYVCACIYIYILTYILTYKHIYTHACILQTQPHYQRFKHSWQGAHLHHVCSA